MTEIRQATLEDIDAIMPLARMMHAESPRYSRLRWNEEKARATLTHLVQAEHALALVAVRDGVVMGGVIGACIPHWFSDDLYSTDFAAFVAPDARGAATGMRLIVRYVEWAQQRGATVIEFGVMAGINVGRTVALLERIGFTRAGVVMEVA